jgi:Cu(I)/Ag(I) efflux system membrane protein CusA/SilA
MMTVITIFAGLMPLMIGSGTGAEVMQRIAAPMIGGMVTATLLTLFIIPAVFLLWHRRGLPAESLVSGPQWPPSP